MSHWKRWPDDELNTKFAEIEHPDRIVYPDLNDGSPLVLACDHSGEHATPEFRVVSFLVTTYKSLAEWDPLRSAVRKRHLTDGRRMSFKALNDALRVNAFSTFLNAASHLNGVLICVGVEKGFSFPKDQLPPRQHDWTPDTLNKLVEVCVFGGLMVNGLRTKGQDVHWITDDDSTVATDKAKADASNLLGGVLHKHPDEYPQLGVGVASQFDDDLRAEDLVAIPDLAAGAYSETLTTMGKENMPTSGTGPQGAKLFLQIKSSLINSWRYDSSKPLKHMNAVIRSFNGQMLVSFGAPFSRRLRPDESAEGAPTLNAKWRRALEADLKARDIDPNEILKTMGIDT
ncbi:hypothetical protein R5W23_005677 [Gemmata sp. JC673]|uniref:N-formylglutamate amidohydrolase n=1 Tax=Gemmata algarum TaxID=2975278 RepID=A0ABU5EVR4_9BACT|nr:hypothetical protein [Gemmata algarum]MDY3558557.1 hypothetical protein [Gemmata algarum]